MNREAVLEHLDYRAFYRAHIPNLTGNPQASGKCPLPEHDDQRASFSVNLENGLFNCHGCGKKGDVFTFYQKLECVDFKMALKKLAAFAGMSETTGNGGKKITGIYSYRDEEGRELYQICRFEPKDFRPRRKGPDGSWIYDLQGVRRVPYNLPELLNASGAVIVEGEKDADNLRDLGFTVATVATTSNGGAKGWRLEYSDYFPGKQVAIISDNDRTGLEYAETVARSLQGKAASIKIVELPGLGERTEKHGLDVSDWIDLRRKEGKGDEDIKGELTRLIKEAPAWDIPQEGPTGLVTIDTVTPEPSDNSFNSSWPIADESMFHGLAGEIVKTIEPQTEADPVALLIQTLAAFGNVVGRGAYFQVEADRHYPNIFACLIGGTSKGRKGTSWGHIQRFFCSIDPEWQERILSGLSSGEGLIWTVRDPIRKGETIIDEGITDKRLLVIEPEFASVLKAAGREGNTLSATLRQAWDSGTLRTLTKNSPAKATDALIALIAHITSEELLRYLNSTEAANGFANRILWICVRRSKCLPRGGQIHKVDFGPILRKLKESIDFAQNAGRIEPSEKTWKIWEAVYPELSEGKPGLLGAVTSRAEAQVMRLAMIHALLDRSNTIEVDHLTAALALWDYAFESAKYVFGDSMGNPMADEILDALRNSPKGLTRTDIYNSFGRHKRSAEITHGLDLLFKRGLAIKKEILTEGRSTELWTAQKAQKAYLGGLNALNTLNAHFGALKMGFANKARQILREIQREESVEVKEYSSPTSARTETW